MVHELVVCVLVAPMLGTVVMRLLADRVPAGVAVVAFTVSACLLALGTALVLLASGVHTTTALVTTGKHGWTSEAWADAGRETWLSGPCMLAAAWSAAAAARVWRRQRAALRAAGAEAAALPGADIVVVVPGEYPDAFTLPGSPGRIVVTEAMRAALSSDELGVVLAHERAHLMGRHHRYIDAARLAAASQPLLRPVARLVEFGVERWADERAALEIGDRARVARAIGVAALAGAARSPVGSAPVGAGCPAGHVALAPAPSVLRIAAPGWREGHVAAGRREIRPGPVPRRVLALLRPLPSSGHLSLLAIPAVLSLCSCLWAGDACYDVHAPFRVALALDNQLQR
ncbi:M56 family metallopeptidase [Frankia sp. CNm7]|uniref:M56 family metallopeptidase n=1 Tax=Frankia nepalensis TaxID=1836974 RepID=A0A937RT74_9ACTN|nr:M56 family metallopeptidase [Frankia nepalensis]MBL7494911.1 M56 family metallopeptidase [Frankia nepalensis]MBL7514431.1 M56 family metallopeptidase [Frankia nepalensis]MBL7521171.1 M56 family metallopeptidase [Frankia nepalensis]MBL7632904.1 M56 family metallopeptidase [Frankia nepalensis]